MGFGIQMSIKTLEIFDYNLSKAADYMINKTNVD